MTQHPTIQHLVALLAAQALRRQEIQRLKQHERDMESERQALIESGKCDDPSAVKRAGEILTICAMIPFRIQQIEVEIKKAGEALYPACAPAREHLDASINTESNLWFDAIAKCLKPLLAREETRRDAAVGVFGLTDASVELSAITQTMPVCIGGGEGESQAHTLVNLAGQLERWQEKFSRRS